MKTITLLITDTHFGTRANSITWLNSQKRFIYNQLIPYIKDMRKKLHKDDRIRLIHLGDVFDSRSSISTMIAASVQQIMADLRSCVDSFFIIAGNHDFYSPNSDEINTLDLILDQMDINLVTKNIYQDGSDLFIPWYQYMREDYINEYIKQHNIKRIFTHADIVTEQPPYNIDIFSGHIHTPSLTNKLYNIGSCYPLNFADSNSSRGFYVLDDNVTFVPNTESIKFWRLYNDDIFNRIEFISNDDYIEIYISQSLMMSDDYIKQLNKITKKFKNIWIIPQQDTILLEGMEKFEWADIEQLTISMIPDHLIDKFKQILDSIKKE